MSELPTGTVTLVFTDIEGSTRLLHELGSRYADVLDEHRQIVREAFATHGGVEVDTQGDAFFYVFGAAKEALAAAGDAQAALADQPVRIRIGVHTGEPVLAAEGYVGADVHRAARIAGSGHGGQVLVSATTAALADVELHDLGSHRLKDLLAAERIYQLGHAKFPPLRSLTATSLPLASSALVGREREVEELVSLIRGSHRLVTLTGPGGTGKTRLALQVAAELGDAYPEGVYWVSLAGVADSSLVLPTMRQAVGASDDLVHELGERALLFVLDTFEHLSGAARDLAELLSKTRDVRLLVTSRAPLHVSAEFEYIVEPLPPSDAATLFVERARAVGRDVDLREVVSQICDRLDNLPLAIELAAARSKLLAPAALLSRLEKRLPLLAAGPRDVPERQRTLSAAIAWSYDLLDPNAQTLFRRLAVFAGGFSLEAAEEVAEADLDRVSILLDASLLKSVADSRLLMLGTIREYGLERLEEVGESGATRDRHASYFAQLANGRWPELARGDNPAWTLAVVQLDVRNFHAAVEWSLKRGRVDDVFAIASGIFPFWSSFGYHEQARRWLEQALAEPGGSASGRANGLLALGDLALEKGERDSAKRANEASVEIFRAIDEPLGVAVNLTQLADIALLEGNLTSARELAEESVAIRRERLASFHLGRALATLADISVAEGDYGRARELLEEAIEYWSIHGPESNHQMNGYEAMGEVLRLQREYRRALDAFAISLQIARARGEPAPETLEGVAVVWAALGEAENAARIAGATERLREQIGGRRLHPDRSLPNRVEPAWSEGRAMDHDDAAEYVLAQLRGRGGNGGGGN